MRGIVILAFAAAACSEPVTTTMQIDAVEPSYGPLGGGTTTMISGDGFSVTSRVVIAGREAPYVRAVSATQLEVVIPAGEQPGDAEVIVLDSAGTTSARGVFRYSEAPTILDVSPRDVVYTAADTIVTITGTGFADEDAGDLYVLVGGVLADAVTVVSDSELHVTVPPGRVFTQPELQVINSRGSVRRHRALRYTPGPRPGLLLFPRWTPSFVVFFDPFDHSVVQIPAASNMGPQLKSVARDRDGNYVGVDIYNRIGSLDLDTQTLRGPVTASWRLPALTRVGDELFALGRLGTARFGTVDVASGTFTQVGDTALFCCGGFGLAWDGTTMWFTQRQDGSTFTLNTIDPTTGVVGTPLVLTSASAFRIEDMTYFGGRLYAVTAGGQLGSIDPATGLVTLVPVPAQRYQAIEVFE